MKFKINFMLCIIDFMFIFMATTFVSNWVIKLILVSIMLLLSIYFIYTCITIIMDKFQDEYIYIKKEFDNERIKNTQRYEQVLNENEKYIRMICNGIGEIITSLSSQNKFIEDGNNDIKRVFEMHTNHIREEYSTSFRNNMNIIDNMRNTFESNINEIGTTFNKEINNTKESLIKGVLEGNRELYDKLNEAITSLNSLIKDNIDELKEVHILNSNELSNTLITSSIELSNKLTSSSIELRENFEATISNLNDNLTATLNEFIQNIEVLKHVNTSNVVNVEKVAQGLIVLQEGLTSKLNELMNNGEVVLSSLSENTNALKEALSDNLENMKNEISQGNISFQEGLKGLKEIVEDIGALHDDGLNDLKTTLREESNNNIITLTAGLEKNITSMNRKFTDENRIWKDQTEELQKSNSSAIIEVKNLIVDLSKLHSDLLKELDNNQKRMMELGEEDIKLMREMIG
ncbi:MAG: hypothetical protein ACRC2K_06830 [Clostridium sp.]